MDGCVPCCCSVQPAEDVFESPVFHPDAILFDLEDAVAYAEKDRSGSALRAMAQLDFGTCRVFVRINSLPHAFWRGGCRAVVPGGHPGICASPCVRQRQTSKSWTGCWMQ